MKSKSRSTQIIVTVFLLFSFNIAFAALPTSLDYQGHLTDNAGAPVDATVDMTFRIYNLEAGGAVLWSNTLPVTVQQGVFSVELGGTANPFPLGLFEQPLWLGLEVGSDGEMSPRRPITSTGFAFKADDANTLEGVSASTLDQSAHVSDMANPHNVTAAQVGAADLNELATHIANSANPHSVTAAQTGAATSGDFSTHTGNASAHHPRYTNGEAVSAMGAKSDSNALNHNRYSNANAVTAILDADGTGSTLDADKVDGLEANEIIDAAQDEVRTPIDHLPFIINSPGSYYFTGNLTGSTGITVNADNVTIDLMGFTLSGDLVTNSTGIYLFGNNVEVRNGTVRDFGLSGIGSALATQSHRVVGMRVTENSGSGISLESSESFIQHCTADRNGGVGISASVNSTVDRNIATRNDSSGILVDEGGTITNNVANHNAGDGIRVLYDAYVANNVASNNDADGIFGGSTVTGNLVESNGNSGIFGAQTITNNTANNNVSAGIHCFIATVANNVISGGGAGIYCPDSAVIKGNTVKNGQGIVSIRAGDGATITGNTVSNNSVLYAIQADNGATITGNTITDNQHWGIFALAGTTIRDNTIYRNNTSDTADEGGIYVYFGVQAKGNTVVDNKQNDIYVFGRYNSIEENLLIGSGNGVWFQSDYQNFYANNRASNNTVDYANTAGQTDGGGNVSF